MDLRNAYKNSWGVAWKMLNPVWTTIDWAKWKTQKFQEKRDNPTMNNYKSNLNLTTYNSRYPNFDEADYKKLEQMAINRGLIGEQKTQFMDTAYQYYYPQVLNQHWLDARAEEINKTTSEHGSAILNGDKTAEYNLKLIDLAQTAKRVKWFAYDYPDEQIIDAMKNEIPDWEQLILNYLNNGDDTILYKAGLKKTEDQTLTDVYNARKDGINKALVGSWKELSGDGLKYLRDYTVIFQTVDEARKQWMGQGMSDNELLRNLMYVSPELQELKKEIWGLTLDNQDKRILWIKDSNAFHRWVDTVRDWLWWNWDKAATLDDIAQEMYVRENMDGQTWKNFLVNWRNAGDDFAKFTYRTQKDLDSWVAWLNHALMNKNLAQLNLWRKLTDEEYQQYIDELKQQEQAVRSQNINEVKEFNETTDQEREAYKKKIWLDPIIENYYNNQWIIESIANQDVGWAWYKWVWEAAWNVDMLAWIAGSMVNPAIWMAIMWTDAFARENQEAFETLVNAQTKQWVPYEEAYNNARDWAVVVWLINTAIELWLEKVLGWVETTASKNLKEIATKSLNKEVTDMMARRWILDMLGKWLETQARSSLEEWLEEVFQQLVQNIAESWYDPDKQVSEWLWRAFESWALNPMNLLAWWSELLNNSNQIKQSMYNSAYDAGAITRNIVDAPKNIISKIKNKGNTNWNVNLGTTENATVSPTTQRDVATDINDWSIEFVEDESFDWTNTDETAITPQKSDNSWWDEAMDGLDKNTREKIRQNPYTIEKWKEIIENLKQNPWFDFLDRQAWEYEDILDVILEKLDNLEEKRSKDVWDLYDKLEEANTPIDTTNILNNLWDYKTSLEDLTDELSNTDKTRIEKILGMIENIGDGTTDVWKIRKKIDAFTKKWQWATNEWIYFLKNIRKDIDSEIQKQNPNMKEVDKEYVKVLDEIRKLQWDIVYKKTWEAKNNAVNTVKNMLNTKNRLYLKTLEKYIPWITKQLQAIRDSKFIFDSYTTWSWSRFTGGVRKWVSKAIWGLVGWLVWWIFWPAGAAWWAFLGSLFDEKINNATLGMTQKALEKTIWQETEVSKAELERINQKIQENQKLEAEEKRKLKELWEKIMSNMATMEKTNAEQSAWETYLANLEENEVLDMPEEVYDQWEEVTTTPKEENN